jgi:adenylate cyclase
VKKPSSRPIASTQFVSLALGLFSGLFLLAIKLNPAVNHWLTDFEDLTYDYRVQTRPRQELNPDILLIGLTDYDLDAYRPDIENRKHHYRLLQTLTNLGVDSVLYDIVFVSEIHLADTGASEEPYRGDDDLGYQMQLIRTFLPYFFYINQRVPDLAELVQRKRLVDDSWYLPYSPEMGGDLGEGWEALSIKIPSPPLVENARGLGHINVHPDSDGVVRRIPLLVRYRDERLGDNLYPSISLRYVLDHLGVSMRDLHVRFGDAIEFTGRDGQAMRIPINEHGEMLINFRQGRGFTEHRQRSFSSETMTIIGKSLNEWMGLPLGSRPPLDAFNIYGRQVPRSLFQGALVLIGEVAVASTDIRATSIDRALPMITVHANVINSLLNRDFVRQTPRWVEPALVILVGLLSGLVFGRIGYIRSFLFAPFLAAVFIAGAWWAFVRWSLWVPLTLPLITLLFAGISILLLHLLTEEKRRAIIRQAFEAYTSPEVVDEILENIDDPALWGAKRRVTMLFVDIRGFTTLTEQTPPEMIVEILSDYYQTAVEAIRRHGGIPNKFIGDAIMALFGAPRAIPNPEEAACRAAVDIQLAVRRLNVENLKPNMGREIAVGVGINTGEVIVGIVGREKIEYTALGDDVNVASRLQGQARPGQVLIGQSTYESLERTGAEFLRTAIYQVRRIPEIVLKGLTRRFEVYELCYERRERARV